MLQASSVGVDTKQTKTIKTEKSIGRWFLSPMPSLYDNLSRGKDIQRRGSKETNGNKGLVLPYSYALLPCAWSLLTEVTQWPDI
jgi:hypothetical protein